MDDAVTSGSIYVRPKAIYTSSLRHTCTCVYVHLHCAFTRCTPPPRRSGDVPREPPVCPHPPLCFAINARPPLGFCYYFAYGLDMNPDRWGGQCMNPHRGDTCVHGQVHSRRVQIFYVWFYRIKLFIFVVVLRHSDIMPRYVVWVWRRCTPVYLSGSVPTSGARGRRGCGVCCSAFKWSSTKKVGTYQCTRVWRFTHLLNNGASLIIRRHYVCLQQNNTLACTYLSVLIYHSFVTSSWPYQVKTTTPAACRTSSTAPAAR